MQSIHEGAFEGVSDGLFKGRSRAARCVVAPSLATRSRGRHRFEQQVSGSMRARIWAPAVNMHMLCVSFHSLLLLAGK